MSGLDDRLVDVFADAAVTCDEHGLLGDALFEMEARLFADATAPLAERWCDCRPCRRSVCLDCGKLNARPPSCDFVDGCLSVIVPRIVARGLWLLARLPTRIQRRLVFHVQTRFRYVRRVG